MFESVMWTYMNEEKDCLQNLLDHKETIRTAAENCADLQALYITAHGSSYNAAGAAAAFISRIAKVRVYAYTPSSFRYNASSIHAEDKEHTVVLGISQTGTSRGVLEALESAAEFKRIAVTNEKDSPIDAMCDQTLYLGCGEENSNAKTKGYSATLLTLMIFGIELAAVKGVIGTADIASYYEELQACVNAIPEVINKTVKWCEMTGYGTGMDNLYVIGNGMNFATAMEGQLKLMETQCIPTMFNDIVEFSHGMHRSLTEHSNVILLNSAEEQELTEQTVDYLRQKGIPAVMLNGTSEKEGSDVINVGFYPLTSSILTMTAALQAISAFVPEHNGMDPNRDANNDYTDFVSTRVK
ncbi:MAG: SIS domain-containing protein [Solobacterium sp.]|nr:SIS domain-containing protein [Solobacterium sp.]